MSIQTKDGKLDPAIQSKTDKTIKRVFRVFGKHPIDFGFLDNAKTYANNHFEKTGEVLAIELIDLDEPQPQTFASYIIEMKVCPKTLLTFYSLKGCHSNGSYSPSVLSFSIEQAETLKEGVQKMLDELNDPSFSFLESFETEVKAFEARNAILWLANRLGLKASINLE